LKSTWTRRSVAVGSMLLTGLAVCVPAQANTTPPPPTAAFAGGVIEASGGGVVVRISYTCTTFPGTIGNHLFVALKQGPTVSPTNPSSGGGNVSTFYSTNWKSDAGPNALDCDGQAHVQSIVLKAQPGFDATAPDFSSGSALLQVCVYDNVTGFNEYGEPIGGSATPYTMQTIRAAGR
jgi:hypothetical protein